MITRSTLDKVCDIKSITDDYFAPLAELEPRTFRYNDDPKDTVRIGFIADELAKLKGYERAVMHGDSGKIEAVNVPLIYIGLIFELRKLSKKIYSNKDLDKYVDLLLAGVRGDFEEKLQRISRENAAKLQQIELSNADKFNTLTTKIARMEEELKTRVRQSDLDTFLITVERKLEQLSATIRNEVNRMGADVNNCNMELNTRLRKTDVTTIVSEMNTHVAEINKKFEEVTHKFDALQLDTSRRCENLGAGIANLRKAIEDLGIFSEITRKSSGDNAQKLAIIINEITAIRVELLEKSEEMRLSNNKLSNCLLKCSDNEAKLNDLREEKRKNNKQSSDIVAPSSDNMSKSLMQRVVSNTYF